MSLYCSFKFWLCGNPYSVAASAKEELPSGEVVNQTAEKKKTGKIEKHNAHCWSFFSDSQQNAKQQLDQKMKSKSKFGRNTPAKAKRIH